MPIVKARARTNINSSNISFDYKLDSRKECESVRNDSKSNIVNCHRSKQSKDSFADVIMDMEGINGSIELNDFNNLNGYLPKDKYL